MNKLTALALTLSMPVIASGIPNWVMDPAQGIDKDLLGAASCTVTTGDFAMDRTIASTDARSELVKQFEIAVQNEVESNKESNAEVTNDGGNVSRKSSTTINVSDNSETIAQAILKNSKVVKAEYVTMNNQLHFCTLVAVTKNTITES